MFVRAWLVVVVDVVVVVECDNCSERGHERLQQQHDLFKSSVILYIGTKMCNMYALLSSTGATVNSNPVPINNYQFLALRSKYHNFLRRSVTTHDMI